MSDNNWDELIAALDDYKDIRDTRQADLGRPGHYDPCDYQMERYELDIKDATERLNTIFKTMVRKAAHGCQCPHQPLA